MYDKELVKGLQARNLTVFEEVYTLKLEIVKGCNLSCDFCGRSRVDGPKRMTSDTFKKILDGCTDRLKRVEFAVHGEPTLHNQLGDFTKFAREKFPQAQLSMYTNTVIYKNKGFKELLSLFDDGMSIIQLDTYSEEQDIWVRNQLQIHYSYLKDKGIKLYDFYKDKFTPWSYKGFKEKILILASEYKGFNEGNMSTRSPHIFAGNLKYEYWKGLVGKELSDFPMNKVCTEPLKYMTIGYNGDVYLCCADGAKAIVIDNVHNRSTNEIWQSTEFHQLRNVLKLGWRDHIIPCSLCNVISYRSGLYPLWTKNFTLTEVMETLYRVHKIDTREPLYSNITNLLSVKTLPEHIGNILQKVTVCTG